MTPQSNTETNQKPFPHVTKAQVVELCKDLVKAEVRNSNIGLQNMPTDPVARVDARAECRMARDALSYAQEQYDRAFDAWARGGYQE